jgi:hypothetical protein
VNKDENKEENHILAHFLPTDESIEWSITMNEKKIFLICGYDKIFSNSL